MDVCKLNMLRREYRWAMDGQRQTHECGAASWSRFLLYLQLIIELQENPSITIITVTAYDCGVTY
jgi:hypothetical protein